MKRFGEATAVLVILALPLLWFASSLGSGAATTVYAVSAVATIAMLVWVWRRGQRMNSQNGESGSDLTSRKGRHGDRTPQRDWFGFVAGAVILLGLLLAGGISGLLNR